MHLADLALPGSLKKPGIIPLRSRTRTVMVLGAVATRTRQTRSRTFMLHPLAGSFCRQLFLGRSYPLNVSRLLFKFQSNLRFAASRLSN